MTSRSRRSIPPHRLLGAVGGGAWLALFIGVAPACAQAAESGARSPADETPCSTAWYQSIEESVSTGDGHGHGPDLGSDEWKSVVEFRLGIRGEATLPPRNTDAWCDHIDAVVRKRRVTANGDGNAAEAQLRGPSYSCDAVEAGSIEALVCEDADLSALDRTLAGVYAGAAKKATNEHPPRLKAEQRGWIKGRNECWKSDDRRGCVRDEYRNRIAELQARYRLVPGDGPIRYACDGNAANEIVVTFFRTDPPTVIAERGDSVSLMYLQPSDGGTKYQGRNETFWERPDDTVVTWGYGVPEMHCTRTP